MSDSTIVHQSILRVFEWKKRYRIETPSVTAARGLDKSTVPDLHYSSIAERLMLGQIFRSTRLASCRPNGLPESTVPTHKKEADDSFQNKPHAFPGAYFGKTRCGWIVTMP
jgi:hypothetical protein